MYYIGVTEGTIDSLKKRQYEDKLLNFHLFNTLVLPEGVHKI